MKFVFRQQLESMSTPELLVLADKYGIDIPGGLDRNFIIGELLEAEEEFETAEDKPEVQISDSEEPVPDELPATYNNTCIDAILRNPACFFVFWDIKESDISSLTQDSSFESVFLRISFFDDDESETPYDFFDVKIQAGPGEQYIMIPGRKKFARIDMAASFAGRKAEVLASTRMIEIPEESKKIQDMQPGKKIDFSPLVQLSGIKKILHDNFLNHRQSFSN
ncbi:DUF4912 domain-containing protein [Treponema sp.]|uniref:DUF4912 domain-containing protein n=1 Tax=Treponema sp. TaxID=166 RepID=UPI003F0843FE